MGFEKFNTAETLSSNREKLLSLEREGKFVFHGSLEDINKLEPRQAYNYSNETGKMEPDGDPAVFATQFADVAIFRSLINDEGVKGESTSAFGLNDDGLYFKATKNLLEAAKQKSGKVYVLDKSNFEAFKGMQCRSDKVCVPCETVRVTYEDLPKNIKVIELEKGV